MSDPTLRDDLRANRAVVGVVVREEKLLVIRRSQHVVAPGKICFPGGGVVAGESESNALIREFREELGVAVRPLRLLWNSVAPWRVALSWWLAELPLHEVVTPDPAEVESVRWLTLDEMLADADLLESNREFLEKIKRQELLLR